MQLCSYEVLDFSNLIKRAWQEIATVKQRFVSRFSLHNYIVRIINHYDVEDEQWAVRGLQVENIAFDYRSLLRSTAHRLRTRASYYVDAVSLDIYLDSSFLVGYNEIIAAARNVTRLKSCGIMRGIYVILRARLNNYRCADLLSSFCSFYSQCETNIVPQLTTEPAEWSVITSHHDRKSLGADHSALPRSLFTHALVAVTCLGFERGRPRTWNRELACDYGVEVKKLALPEVLTWSGSSLRTGIAVAGFFFHEKRSSTRVRIHEVFRRSYTHVCKNNLHAATRAIILTYADWTYATRHTQQSALVRLD